jgi:hypothetical protein
MFVNVTFRCTTAARAPLAYLQERDTKLGAPLDHLVNLLDKRAQVRTRLSHVKAQQCV